MVASAPYRRAVVVSVKNTDPLAPGFLRFALYILLVLEVEVNLAQHDERHRRGHGASDDQQHCHWTCPTCEVHGPQRLKTADSHWRSVRVLFPRLRLRARCDVRITSHESCSDIDLQVISVDSCWCRPSVNASRRWTPGRILLSMLLRSTVQSSVSK